MAKKHLKAKKCPPTTFFFAPTLKALDELGGSGSNEEIYNRVLMITHLSTEIIDEMHNFTMTEVEYRLAWARTYLRKSGLIIRSKNGVWALTKDGEEASKESSIDRKKIIKNAYTQKNTI